MKKILSTLAIIFLSLPILLQAASAHDALAKPEDQVSAFYRWYIQKQSGHTFPLLDHEISKYVAEPTIKRLRSDYKHGTLPGDADYFTKVQDYDEQDWLRSIRPANPIALGDVTVVPVTFGSKDRVNVLVFLKRDGTGWKIIKVDDTWGYQ
nr:DUF3828 domain-containing protein [uncultured Ralstonia sp.]